jgi:surface antigen
MFSALPMLAARSLRRLSAMLAVLATLGTLLLASAQPAAAAVHDRLDQATSFESSNFPGRYMRHRNYLADLLPLTNEWDRNDATFFVRRGLDGNPASVSFESANFRGRYLKHAGYRIQLAAYVDSQFFKWDASFLPRPSRYSGQERFESVNFPGHFIKHQNYQLWLVKDDNSIWFHNDSSWRPVSPSAANVTQGRGECTDWALYKRPDLRSIVSGNAQEWTAQARNAGRPVSKTPSQGAVMVLKGGVMGAGATTGHVTYVESVQRDAYGNPTSFVVSEQNWNGNRYPTTRTIQVRDLPPSGVDFIR